MTKLAKHIYNKGLADYYATKPLYIDVVNEKKPSTRKITEFFFQLINARLHKRAFSLLIDSPDWMDAKLIETNSNISYKQDIDIALKSNPDLITMICLHVARETSTAQISDYDQEDLIFLTKLGRKQEALAIAKSLESELEQSKGLFAIYNCGAGNNTDFGLLKLVVDKAKNIKSVYNKSLMLHEIACILSENGLFDRAYEIIAEIASPLERSKALKTLGQAMRLAKDNTASIVFTESIDAARSINDIYSQATCLIEIAKELVHSGDPRNELLLIEASQIANQEFIGWKWYDLQTKIAMGWCDLQNFEEVTLIAKIIKTQCLDHNIHNSENRLSSLREIAILLINGKKNDLVRNIINWITDDNYRAINKHKHLANIALALHQTGDNLSIKIFNLAIKETNSFDSEMDHAFALAEIAMIMFDGNIKSYDETLKLALGLLSFEEDYDENKLLEFIEILAQMGWFKNAIETAFQIRLSTHYRAVSFEIICKFLISAGRINQALDLVDQIRVAKTHADYDEFGTLGACSRILSSIAIEHVNKNKLAEAINVCELIDKYDIQVNTLGQIALIASKKTAPQASILFNKALQAIDLIKNKEDQATALKQLSKQLFESGDSRASQVFDQSIKLHIEFNDENKSLFARKNLACALSRAEYFNLALKIAGDISNDHGIQDLTHETIAVALAKAGHFDHALSLALTLPDKSNVLCTISKMLKTANQFGRSATVLNQALDSAMNNTYGQSGTLIKIACQFSETGNMDKALEVISKISDSSILPMAFASVAAELEGMKNNQYLKFLDHAIECASGILDHVDRSVAYSQVGLIIANFSGTKSTFLFDKAIDSAMLLDESTREYSLGQVAKDLVLSGNYNKALEIVNRLKGNWTRLSVYLMVFKSMAGRGIKESDNIFEKIIEEVHLIDTYMGARDQALNKIIIDLIEKNEIKKALVAFKLMSTDSASSSTSDSANLIAKALSFTGNFTEAFQILDIDDITSKNNRLSVLICQLALWIASFENVEKGLSFKIFIEIVRISGWKSPMWNKIYYSLNNIANNNLLETKLL